MKTKLVYALAFVLITTVCYLVFSYIDYSYKYFTLIRLSTIVLGYFTIVLINKYILKKKLMPSTGILIIVVSWILIAISIDQINDYLLDSNNLDTTGIVKDCEKSRGSKYFVFSYYVNGTLYENKQNNEMLNLKDGDSVIVQYFKFNPAIARVK